MDMVVDRVMIRGRQRSAISAVNGNAAVAGFINIATRDAIVCPAGNIHREIADVSQSAADNGVVRPAFNFDGGSARRFKSEIFERNVGSIFGGNQIGS